MIIYGIQIRNALNKQILQVIETTMKVRENKTSYLYLI